MKLLRSICSVAAATALSSLTLSSTAAADSLPSYAANTANNAADTRETIHGRISSVPGKYDVYVRDDRGYVDHVVLHDGTVINPTGLTLAAGDTVTIMGGNEGRVFRADEVDTPYSDDMQSNDYDGGDGYQAYPADYPDGYGNAYGYGYPGFGGLYFGVGGGYYGGGYSGRYLGHGSHGGGYDNRGSEARGGHVGGSSRLAEAPAISVRAEARAVVRAAAPRITRCAGSDHQDPPRGSAAADVRDFHDTVDVLGAVG